MTKSSCAVSRAHLTCDPGTSTDGYNSVVAVVKFASQVDGDAFSKAFIDSTVTPAADSPMTQRMTFVGGYMRWKSMGPEWSALDHISIRKEILPVEAIEESASLLLATSVDLTKPCWSIEFLENVLKSDGLTISVCILKYHHALADGFTMIQQMMGKVSSVSDPAAPVRSLFPTSRNAEKPAQSATGRVMKSLFSMLKMRSDKESIYRSKIARKTTDTVSVVLSNGGGITVSRLKALSDKLSSADKKYSINDLLTTIIAMSLGEQKNAPAYVSSVVWVSLEKDYDEVIDPRKWDNSKLGFGYIQLPLGVADPMESLSLCHARLQALKCSTDPYVINTALRCIGCLPRSVGKCISSQTADKASISMSNLVGPRNKVKWPAPEGWTIDSMHFATSPPFHFGPLFSILSYDNNLCVTISARSDMLSQSDLHVMANDAFLRAIQRLESL